MNKNKARLVVVALFVLLVLLCADAVAIWPDTLPWILGAFAIPGAWKFCRVLFIWLTTDEEPVRISLFKRKEKPELDYHFWADGGDTNA